MNRNVTGNLPKALGGALALLLVALTLAAGLAETGAAPAADDLVWVRQANPVINVNNDPTFWEAPEGDRFEGSFWEVFVDETAITYEERFVDHGYEYYVIMLRSEFDQPPRVLYPAQRYELTAYASHNAAKVEGAGGIGFQFWYDSNGATVDPREVLAYYPWSPYFTGTNSKEWMVSAPEPRQEGDTFQLWASWWNCPPCNVTWTYKAEPATAVEQLGAEVATPVVTYQGEEVPPGETFFPETCALPGARVSKECRNTIDLEKQARLRLTCARAESLGKTLLIMELLELDGAYTIARGWILYERMVEACGEVARAGDEFELGLYMAQGGLLLTNIAAGQMVAVTTPLAKATTTRLGTFAVGYNPDSDAALFQAHSVPITIQPAIGASLILQSHQRVALTEAGFGPVTDLPHLFLPVQMR